MVLVSCLTSQQHASVSQGRICSDHFTCCRTESEVADQTLHLTRSQYTDTGPSNPSTDPRMPGAWQGIATGVPVFKSVVCLYPEKIPAQAGFESQIRSPDSLTTWPTRRCKSENPYLTTMSTSRYDKPFSQSVKTNKQTKQKNFYSDETSMSHSVLLFPQDRKNLTLPLH